MKNRLNKLKDKINLKMIAIFTFIMSLICNAPSVYAVEKIEGGDVTIESLGTIIKNLATKIQIFGVIAAFVAVVVFVIQFIIGDDETKQRKKKTIIYSLAGLVILILVPSIINFLIDTFD